MDTATLYKLLDTARAGAGVLVGLCTYLLSAADVLHLPPVVTGVLAGVVATATHYGVRAYTTPHPSSNTSGRSIVEDQW